MQAISVCSALSFVASTSLLIGLAYKSYTEYRLSQEASSDAGYARRSMKVSFHTQGYFWLVNLFIAGSPLSPFRPLMCCRFRSIVGTIHHYPPTDHRSSHAWKFLQLPRVFNQLWRYCLGYLVIYHCRPYLYIACRRTKVARMGGGEKHGREDSMGLMYLSMAVCGLYRCHRVDTDSESEPSKGPILYFVF